MIRTRSSSVIQSISSRRRPHRCRRVDTYMDNIVFLPTLNDLPNTAAMHSISHPPKEPVVFCQHWSSDMPYGTGGKWSIMKDSIEANKRQLVFFEYFFLFWDFWTTENTCGKNFRKLWHSRCTFIILGKSVVRSMRVLSGFVNAPPVCPCCLVEVYGVSYKVSPTLL